MCCHYTKSMSFCLGCYSSHAHISFVQNHCCLNLSALGWNFDKSLSLCHVSWNTSISRHPLIHQKHLFVFVMITLVLKKVKIYPWLYPGKKPSISSIFWNENIFPFCIKVLIFFIPKKYFLFSYPCKILDASILKI